MQGKDSSYYRKHGECTTLGIFFAPRAPSPPTRILLTALQSALGGALALAGPLGSAGLHLLLREAAHVTTGGSVAAFREALLAAEAELLISLLALVVGAIAGTTAALAIGLVSILDGNIEEVIGVVGGGRSVSLALCRIYR